MQDEQPLGELIREFISSLGAYLKQNAADAVNKVLSQPLKRAAKKVVFLALAFGLTFMAAVFLALAFFNVLLELSLPKSAAYAVTCVICLLVGALCALVIKDGKKSKDRGAKGDDGGAGGEVGADTEEGQ